MLKIVKRIDRKILNFYFMDHFAAGRSSALIFLFLLPFATGRFNNTRLIISLLIALKRLGFLVTLESAQQAARVYIGTGREAYGAVFRRWCSFSFWYLLFIVC